MLLQEAMNGRFYEGILATRMTESGRTETVGKRHELVIVPTTLRYPYEDKADMVRPEEGRF